MVDCAGSAGFRATGWERMAARGGVCGGRVAARARKTTAAARTRRNTGRFITRRPPGPQTAPRRQRVRRSIAVTIIVVVVAIVGHRDQDGHPRDQEQEAED